ncbi:hypothetical protein RRG08_046698 [Elysia crispata]|uniref:Uncharacterized protein n=1 Tax=Elysia crispata TaxID=231223 RepID=A0AAE1A9T4_9GAST|nr:hypothetical protein RRG08_046698 [Elysia crispata]
MSAEEHPDMRVKTQVAVAHDGGKHGRWRSSKIGHFGLTTAVVYLGCKGHIGSACPAITRLTTGPAADTSLWFTQQQQQQHVLEPAETLRSRELSMVAVLRHSLLPTRCQLHYLALYLTAGSYLYKVSARSAFRVNNHGTL